MTFSRGECIWSINDYLQTGYCAVLSEAKVHTYIHLLAACGDVTKMKEILAVNPTLVRYSVGVIFMKSDHFVPDSVLRDLIIFSLYTVGQLMNRDILLCMWHALLERATLYRY